MTHDQERERFEAWWKAEYAAGTISKQTLDKLLQKPLSRSVPVAQVHISERSIDLCNNGTTRKLRELIGDGIHNLYLDPYCEAWQAAKREPVVSEAMAKDAERYRFLRSNCSDGYFKSFSKRFQLNCDEPETEWDAAIDAHLTTPKGG